MTGPDHYREAERLADRAHHFTYGDGGDPVTGAALAAEAQVHATLALAAATALQAALPLVGDDQQVTDWGKAIGADLATNQGARITNALAYLDRMQEDGAIGAVDAHTLRRALSGTAGA